MNTEIKKKWLEALRSGKYEQGKKHLRSNGTDQFCCLGVLCDLHQKETGELDWREPNQFFPYIVYGNDGSTAYPPDVVDIWSEFYFASGMTIVSGMNDSGKSFSEIADWIEENL